MKVSAVHGIAFLILALMVREASAAGDPASGERLAKQYCARCHDIAAGGAFKTYPPSFASIAVYRSEDQIRARILFPLLHSAVSPMPEFAQIFVPPKNVDDLTAYILSLERK